MGLIVCKFGGTSLAAAAQLDAVRRIVQSDPRRRLIVASAPGRRSPDDQKITDLLIHRQLDRAKARLQRLADDAGADIFIQLPPNASDDFLASRGEYYCAKILAHTLGCTFVDAARLIRFDDNGALDPVLTAAAIRQHLAPDRPAVIPGFYGSMPNGHIRTLPRGGSDTTGALIAAAMQADLYENFTDVPGLFDTDPALARDAQSVPFASYDEVRLLAHCGASVLHEDALSPVQLAGIPIRLCSTFAPELPGTFISAAPADRPMLSAIDDGDAVRCAAAGRIPPHFMPALQARFPDVPIIRLPCGITFTLPLPPSGAVPLLRGMLYP